MVNHNFASVPWFLMPETPSAGEILQERRKSKRWPLLFLRPSCCREGLGTSKNHWSGPRAAFPGREPRGPAALPARPVPAQHNLLLANGWRGARGRGCSASSAGRGSLPWEFWQDIRFTNPELSGLTPHSRADNAGVCRPGPYACPQHVSPPAPGTRTTHTRTPPARGSSGRHRPSLAGPPVRTAASRRSPGRVCHGPARGEGCSLPIRELSPGRERAARSLTAAPLEGLPAPALPAGLPRPQNRPLLKTQCLLSCWKQQISTDTIQIELTIKSQFYIPRQQWLLTTSKACNPI